jgi:hypothetical protein
MNNKDDYLCYRFCKNRKDWCQHRCLDIKWKVLDFKVLGCIDFEIIIVMD